MAMFVSLVGVQKTSLKELWIKVTCVHSEAPNSSKKFNLEISIHQILQISMTPRCTQK